jgi:hypothetical protein
MALISAAHFYGMVSNGEFCCWSKTLNGCSEETVGWNPPDGAQG